MSRDGVEYLLSKYLGNQTIEVIILYEWDIAPIAGGTQFELLVKNSKIKLIK